MTLFRWSCTLIIISLLCSNAQAQWQNALKPSGRQAGKIKVVESGQPLGAIECPGHPTTKEKKAAADLQHWIEEMTGAQLEIVNGPAHQSVFVIRTDDHLGNEGYSIAVNHGQIILSGGKTRGVINAVYALLEEDLGCRFYTDDSIRLPKNKTLVIAPVARSYTPKLKLRDPYYACAFDEVWSLRNRTEAPEAKVPEEFGGHVDYDGMFVHTAAQIVPPAKYFKAHPDYFALQTNGTRNSSQLCATHPEVVKLAIEHVRQVLKDHPETKIVSVSKNDCQISCHCERCEKLRQAEGSDMACQLFMVNQVAEAIEKDYPDVSVDTLAYLETIQVPKTVRPRKNVVIRLCNDAVGAWSHPFAPAEQCETAKLVAAWGAAYDRIYIWDYVVNFEHYLAPMPNVNVIAANIRFYVKNHAEGVMLQGDYQGPGDQDELKCWVAAKLLWNPALDEKALVNDFIWGHYGKAAPALEKYEALLEKMKTDYPQDIASPKDGIRYPMDAPFFTKDFITQATKMFAEAKELSKVDTQLTRRVERAELPILYVQCVRGPEFVGNSYAQVVDDFGRIARDNKLEFLAEGAPDFEKKLAAFKERIK